MVAAKLDALTAKSNAKTPIAPSLEKVATDLSDGDGPTERDEHGRLLNASDRVGAHVTLRCELARGSGRPSLASFHQLTRSGKVSALMTARDASNFGFSEHLESGRSASNYNRWIAEQFEPFVGQRILEIGCGVGTMSEHWIDRPSFTGIDTEVECVHKCAQRFAQRSGARFVHDRVGAPDWVSRWSEFRPDTIIAINVLEHIREDLAALRGFRAIVEAGGGGHVCLFVPAFEFAYSSFDRRYGHYRRYTKETLRDKLLDAALEIETLRYFNLPGLLGWWSTFVLLRRSGSAEAQLGFYDRAVVPLTRKLERLVTPPFGNSIVAVCRVR